MALSKRGQAHKVDKKWMSRCKQDGVSPVQNKARINLRTMSAGPLHRLEEKMDERNGWALAQTQEELREARVGEGGFSYAVENTEAEREINEN